MATPAEIAAALEAMGGTAGAIRDIYKEISGYTDNVIAQVQALVPAHGEVSKALGRQMASRKAIEKSLENQQQALERHIATMEKGEERAYEKIRLNNIEIEQIKEKARREGKIDKRYS